jgi:hypothetical protein
MISRWGNLLHNMQIRAAKTSLAPCIGHSVILGLERQKMGRKITSADRAKSNLAHIACHMACCQPARTQVAAENIYCEKACVVCMQWLFDLEGAPAVQVVDALQLSRRTFSKIRQNLGWAFAYNIIALPLAAGALLPGLGIALTPSISGMGAISNR